MPNDHFPDTQSTFIFNCLGSQPPREAELRRHLMSVYAAPLRAYFMGTSYRKLTDADEIINGFFIDRLGRSNFIPDWRSSGMKLRRWLMNAMHFYLKEYTRSLKRFGSAGGEMLEAHPASEDELAAAMDREFVRSVVRRAMAIAEESCSRDGFGQHYMLFCQYYIEARSCDELGARTGLGAERVWVMVRTGQRRFVRALRDLLADDGVPPERVDEEIAALLAVGGARAKEPGGGGTP